METINPTQSLLKTIEKNKTNITEGVFSICSANRYVLEASMQKVRSMNAILLIEATCNQVNQFGGYTGMTARDFSQYIANIAKKVRFPNERILLGGDHLGPYPWRNLPAEVALKNSEELVRSYASMGYRKIHIDASMFCQDDDDTQPMSKQLSADRAARICKQAEDAVITDLDKPLYVIGTEVPLPGGKQDVGNKVIVTTHEDISETINIFKNTFFRENLEPAWERVIAVVVQPGVEFGEDDIIDYSHEKASQLINFIEKVPRVVYEAHSTDYQTRENLCKMVEDHFAILKVGPALTYRFREAVFGLEKIEEELFRNKPEIVQSNIIQTILNAMNKNPENWEKYYQPGNDLEIIKLFGLSDRIRYYWNVPEVEDSIKTLISNLRIREIPFSLISQYLPVQAAHIHTRELSSDPEQLILDHIGEEIDSYSYACNLSHRQSADDLQFI